MKTRRTGCSGRIAQALAFALLVTPGSAQVPTPATAGSCPAAPDAAAVFRELEDALVARDGARVKRGVDALVGRVDSAAGRQPTAVRSGSVAAAETELAAAAAAAASCAATGDLPGVGAATRRARRACVLCHVQGADGETGAQRFPASGNTIWGRVTVQDLAGEPRTSHAGVVVFVDEVPDWRASGYAVSPPRVSQRGRRFEPAVLPIVLGDSLDFPNDDTVFHNAFSLSKTHTFDLGIYPQGEVRSVRPTQLGLISVYCNIHPDMKCSILVLQNPCFAVTTGDGAFLITDVPDGEHTFRTWHDFGGDSERRLTVAGGRALRVDLTVRESKPAASHLNKWGKPYRQKY